jgi:lipopolysaccharide export system permease protein
MTILDRYCAREFLKHFTMIIAAFLFLYLIIDFFEKIRMFLSNHATFQQIISFFFFSIPMIVWQTMPAGVLLASLITFGSFSRNNEIMAMKACGVNLFRAAVSIMTIAIVICIINFLISEIVTPYTNEKAKMINLVEIQKQEAAGAFKQNQLWYRGKKGIYNFKIFDPETNLLQGITIYYLDGKLNPTKRVDADWGEWKEGVWVFHNLIITAFPNDKFPDISTSSVQVADMPESPENFKTVQKDTENMGYLELKGYIERIKDAGYNIGGYLVDLHGKLAFPIINIIMAAIGLSYSLRGGKKGGIARGIAVGMVIGFSYWIVFAFTVSLGRAGMLPPLLAAWATNILFCFAVGLLSFRIRT